MKRAILSPLLKKPSLDTELYPSFKPVSNLMLVSKVPPWEIDTSWQPLPTLLWI